VNDSDSAISNVGGFEWSADRMQILPIPCSYGTLLCLSMGYNVGCMIASDTLFHSKDGFPE